MLYLLILLVYMSQKKGRLSMLKISALGVGNSLSNSNVSAFTKEEQEIKIEKINMFFRFMLLLCKKRDALIYPL